MKFAEYVARILLYKYMYCQFGEKLS